MKMIQILSIFLLLIAINTQRNYQQRVIYYGHQDYACMTGVSTDYIDVTINFNDTVIKTFKEVDGNTDCWTDEQIYPELIIKPRPTWSFSNEPATSIRFDQEAQYEFYGPILIRIIQTSRVRNPIKYEKAHYNCEILGNGQRDHYGNNPPVKLYMKCQFLRSLQEKSLTSDE